MKSLSLWQPWASAIALGLKRNETRDWPAVAGGQLFRGWLAICAAKTKKDPQTRESLAQTWFEILKKSEPSYQAFREAGIEYFDDLPFGKVVAVVWLEQCINTTDCQPNLTPGVIGYAIPELELLWGGYAPNRYAWRFTECYRLGKPIDVRGEQKLFNVDLPENWRELCDRVY